MKLSTYLITDDGNIHLARDKKETLNYGETESNNRYFIVVFMEFNEFWISKLCKVPRFMKWFTGHNYND